MPTLGGHPFVLSDAVISGHAHWTHEDVPSEMQPPTEDATDVARTDTQQQ